MRCLGIDYGTVRVGLSYGDELGLAVPLPAATAGTEEARMQQIGVVIEQRRIERLVVGYPYNMDGSVGFKAREVDKFVEVLHQRFGLPVVTVDERLSSYAADAASSPSRQRKARSRRDPRQVQKERKSGVRDSRAATIILQDYLDQSVAGECISRETDGEAS